jgi:hypothetical protein
MCLTSPFMLPAHKTSLNDIHYKIFPISATAHLTPPPLWPSTCADSTAPPPHAFALARCFRVLSPPVPAVPFILIILVVSRLSSSLGGMHSLKRGAIPQRSNFQSDTLATAPMMGLLHPHLKSGCQSAKMISTYMSTTSGAHLSRQPLCIFHLSRRSSSLELVAVTGAHLFRQPLQHLLRVGPSTWTFGYMLCGTNTYLCGNALPT